MHKHGFVADVPKSH